MKYLLSILFTCSLFLYSCEQPLKVAEKIPQSGAGRALDAWAMARSYPGKQINTQKITTAYTQQQSIAQSRDDEADWEAIGPKNIAGRALALAFHPLDSNIIFLGSASGGLWKTTSAGLGATAWEKVTIGFPILAVSSIAISPSNPEVIYIGTGEMYNSETSKPGIVDRLTRGTYGFGIFKSVDGGATWEKSLDWSYEAMRGIQDIVINPLNDQVVYAATSTGLFKSTNAGGNWENIHSIPMAVDIALNPIDTHILYISYGSLFQENSGIYRSLDAGNSFRELNVGIPSQYSGKAMLTLAPTDPNVIFASVADAFQSKGLYRSNNKGDSWLQVNKEDIALHQGWYSHDVAVHPKKINEVIQVGIDTWRSENDGFTMMQQTFWFNAELGRSPLEGPDGPPDYVHSDIHQVYFHPLMENTVFLATDGGVFVSKDGGRTYESRNGGLQTTQFYANFANSSTDPSFAIGGMQDNASAIYTGEDAWIKVLGGDGMSTAIDPINDSIIYGSSQLLNIFRSTDRGATFSDIAPGAFFPIFSAPFEIAPSSPNILYAGGRFLYQSIDRGTTWSTPNPAFIDEGNSILTIAVAPTNPNRLIVSTAPTKTDKANIFSSSDGGKNWTMLSGLPDRLATDITFHPEKEAIAYIVFGGFNNFHVYQTVNGGANWFPIDNNLPDIPHNTIVVDPFIPDNIYIGNDLGIYVSEDEGGTWMPFMNGLPEAVLAMDLSIVPTSQQLRVASHGSGVFQTDLIGKIVSSTTSEITESLVKLEQNFPNPTNGQTTIPFLLKEESQISLKIYDLKGAFIQTVMDGKVLKGEQTVLLNLNALAAGNYIYQLVGETKGGQFFQLSKMLVIK